MTRVLRSAGLVCLAAGCLMPAERERVADLSVRVQALEEDRARLREAIARQDQELTALRTRLEEARLTRTSLEARDQELAARCAEAERRVAAIAGEVQTAVRAGGALAADLMPRLQALEQVMTRLQGALDPARRPPGGDGR